ncbi:MAG: nuclear transport factor 2 family protein [Actinomycetota bacterium]|nr:nuclear transport factor 2 family protein [Actinomycetota bacterium]
MGEAREALERSTEAFLRGDLEAAANCYAEDAVAVTPDEGEIRGREQIVRYMTEFLRAFPDADYEYLNRYETGSTAIDEGYLVGTNTAELPLPDGRTIAATGMRVRLRECDLVTVEDGLITSHRFYWNHMDFMSQLGLLDSSAG